MVQVLWLDCQRASVALVLICRFRSTAILYVAIVAIACASVAGASQHNFAVPIQTILNLLTGMSLRSLQLPTLAAGLHRSARRTATAELTAAPMATGTRVWGRISCAVCVSMYAAMWLA